MNIEGLWSIRTRGELALHVDANSLLVHDCRNSMQLSTGGQWLSDAARWDGERFWCWNCKTYASQMVIDVALLAGVFQGRPYAQ